MGPAGYSLVELLFVIGLLTTVTAATIPPILDGLDDSRTAGAARYMSARLYHARMEAVTRSADVGIKFVLGDGGYEFTVYVDGNGNGVRTRDIARGIDRVVIPVERLPDQFRGVDFGAFPGLPPVDPGGTAPGADPIKLGTSDILTFTATGTSSSGSLYLHGAGRAQYVLRVLGGTGRIHLLKFDRGTGRWSPV